MILSTSRAFMTLTGKEAQTGGPIDYLFSEQRPGAIHSLSSIDVPSASFYTHRLHERTTTARVTGRGVFSLPSVTTTKMLGGMRQHEAHGTGSFPCTAPGKSGSLSTLLPSENDSEDVSRFYDPHWKRDTNGGAHRISFFSASAGSWYFALLRGRRALRG